MIVFLFRSALFVLLVLQLSVAIVSGENPDLGGYYQGIEYAKRGEFEKAKGAFEKSMENARFGGVSKKCLSVIQDVFDQKIKSDTAIHFFKGTDLINQNRMDDAITELTLAIFINLKCADAYNSRGYAYGKTKQFDKAIIDFNKAIELNPDYVEAYNSRGNIFSAIGEFNKAVKDYNRAINLRPDESYAYDNRGFVRLIKLNDTEGGCKDLKRACDLGGCRNYNIAKQKGYCQ